MRMLLSLLLVIAIPSATLAQNANDIDGDGLLNTEEDANGDGIVNSGETDPDDADTDGGGEADGSEVHGGRDPFDRTDDMTYDLDNDGLTNAEELTIGTRTDNPDTDGDGLNDKDDPFPLDRNYTKDTDSDGLPDEYEQEHQLQIDKRADAEEDTDEDGLTNLQEFVEGTDMENEDTDGDGVLDGKETELDSDPLENPCLSIAGPAEVLHDLEDHWSKPYVSVLQQTKSGESGPRIVDGYWTDKGAMFRPDREISRFELLKLALLSNCIALETNVDEGDFSFTDIRRKPRPRESEGATLKRRVIYTAHALGIIEGYGDGSFLPDAPVNRAEALKILFGASELQPFDDADYSGTFTDVDDTAWYAPFLRTALSYAFLEGYEDGTFRPQQPITRAEAAKVVLFIMISNPKVNGYVVPVEDLDL